MKIAIITLAVAVGIAVSGVPSAIAGGDAATIDATKLWEKNCASCHGKDGKGETKAGKSKKVQDLTDPAVRAKFDRARMIKSVKEGIKDEETGKDRMKAYATKLSDAEIEALIDWIFALVK